MNIEYLEFRDILATIVEADPQLDYTPVHNDEGFVTLDEFACHYIHHEENKQATVRLFLLKGEETITSKCDEPAYTYHWTGKAWSCPQSPAPELSSEGLAQVCLHHLFALAESERRQQ